MFYYLFEDGRCVVKCNYEPDDDRYLANETDYEPSTLRLIDGEFKVVEPKPKEQKTEIIETEETDEVTEELYSAIAGLYEIIGEMKGGENNDIA